MSNILIEKVHREDRQPPSLVEEVDALFERIRQKSQSLLEEGDAARAAEFELWLKTERELFWARQVETTEDERNIRIRMAVPGFAMEELSVMVSPGSIVVYAGAPPNGSIGNAVLPEQARLLRRVTLPSPIEVGTLTSIFDRGELKLVAAKLGGRARVSPFGLDRRRASQPRI